jgi:hypothetical protein
MSVPKPFILNTVPTLSIQWLFDGLGDPVPITIKIEWKNETRFPVGGKGK